MRVKFILIIVAMLAIIGIIYAGFFLTIKKESAGGMVSLPAEEISENRLENVQISYYGKNNKYKLEMSIEEIDHKNINNILFKSLEAVLKNDKNEIIQQFTTNQGHITNEGNLVKLTGPIDFIKDSYTLSIDKINIDLNTGFYTGEGNLSLIFGEISVSARKISSDFEFNKIYLEGRPRMIVKKGG